MSRQSNPGSPMGGHACHLRLGNEGPPASQVRGKDGSQSLRKGHSQVRQVPVPFFLDIRSICRYRSGRPCVLKKVLSLHQAVQYGADPPVDGRNPISVQYGADTPVGCQNRILLPVPSTSAAQLIFADITATQLQALLVQVPVALELLKSKSRIVAAGPKIYFIKNIPDSLVALNRDLATLY